jgi:hypothetical protein
MKKHRTRISVGETDFERDLLRSWKSEQPSGDARQNALALFGVGPGVGVSSAASTTKAAGAAKAVKIAALSTSVPPKAATLGVGALGKWIFASVVLTTAVGASVVRSRSAHDASFNAAPTIVATPLAVSSVAPIAIDQIPPPPPLAASEIAPTIAPIAIANATPKIAAHEKSVSAPSIAAADPIASTEANTTDHERSSLALNQEIDAIDHARRVSDSGDYAGALASLDAYDARFPHGALAQESAVLRIVTLFKQGDTENGKLLAQHFLATNPTSPHAARIQALLH